jgi:hypothetical protein
VALYCSHGEQPAGRPLARLPRSGPPPRLSGRCAVGGRPLCPVGGLQAKEGPAKFKQKHPFFLLPHCVIGGKKKDEQCRSKRHRSVLSFFFLFFLNV